MLIAYSSTQIQARRVTIDMTYMKCLVEEKNKQEKK